VIIKLGVCISLGETGFEVLIAKSTLGIRVIPVLCAGSSGAGIRGWRENMSAS
jgi:hypothetical protein